MTKVKTDAEFREAKREKIIRRKEPVKMFFLLVVKICRCKSISQVTKIPTALWEEKG